MISAAFLPQAVVASESPGSPIEVGIIGASQHSCVRPESPHKLASTLLNPRLRAGKWLRCGDARSNLIKGRLHTGQRCKCRGLGENDAEGLRANPVAGVSGAVA